MIFHTQIFAKGTWVDVSNEEFDAWKGRKRYGPIGRETYVSEDGTEYNPWLAVTSMLAAVGGRVLH